VKRKKESEKKKDREGVRGWWGKKKKRKNKNKNKIKSRCTWVVGKKGRKKEKE
jgi:hypothetical protein